MAALVSPPPAHRLSQTEPTPAAVVDGLAVYSLGVGPPLLLMPNPQGIVGSSTSAGSLAGLLIDRGYRVITFDPPGAFASHARPARLDLAEMVDGALVALRATGITPPVAVVGHSQASLAALALALHRAATVAGLVLVGAVDGGARATRRAGGLPFGWSWLTADFWRFVWLGAKLSLGRGSLADYKRLRRLVLRHSYADRRSVPADHIGPADERLPAPPRAGWQRAIRHVDLLEQLAGIQVLTLVCVGRHDPQTPVRGNEEIARAVGDGRLEIFESSGHYPFEEEPERFGTVVSGFLIERLGLGSVRSHPDTTSTSLRTSGD